jgi:hypothetical protein
MWAIFGGSMFVDLLDTACVRVLTSQQAQNLVFYERLTGFWRAQADFCSCHDNFPTDY